MDGQWELRVDLFFREPLGDVWLMASQLDACPGAVEHGLFPASMRPDDPVVLVGRGMGAWSGWNNSGCLTRLHKFTHPPIRPP